MKNKALPAVTMALVAIFIGDARADDDRRCDRMTSPEACHCAMQHGGRIKPDIRPGWISWYAPPSRNPQYLEYLECTGKLQDLPGAHASLPPDRPMTDLHGASTNGGGGRHKL